MGKPYHAALQSGKRGYGVADASVIVEALRPLAAPVDTMQCDPENARRGDVAAIRRSLNVFGQRKPIVVKRTGADAAGRPTGIVIAGNHTYMAACELGWTHIAAVFVDDDATTARAYALADNRTGELATWDDERLAETLRELSAEAFDVSALGWTDDQLANLLIDPDDFRPDPDGARPRLDQRAPTVCPQCSFEWRIGPGGAVEPA
jgi:hypothetical protein